MFSSNARYNYVRVETRAEAGEKYPRAHPGKEGREKKGASNNFPLSEAPLCTARHVKSTHFIGEKLILRTRKNGLAWLSSPSIDDNDDECSLEYCSASIDQNCSLELSTTTIDPVESNEQNLYQITSRGVKSNLTNKDLFCS